MKKILLILMIFLCGNFYIFAQENADLSVKNDSVENEEVSSQTESSIQEENLVEPRFPEGKKPKVAKKVGEGEISTEKNASNSRKKIEFEPNEKTPFEEFNKSIGVFAYAYPGLSWQQWIGNFAYQINFSGMYIPMEYYDYIDSQDVVSKYINSFYMLTAEAQFEFFTVKYQKNWYGRLYGLLLGGFYYKTDYNIPEYFNGIAGIGLGYETLYHKHFSFPIHFGYYAEFPNEFKMDFVFGGGFRFRF